MRRCATTLEAEMKANEHELLLGILKEECFTGAHLEIGTAAGGTLCAMMRCFAEGQRPRFVVVDRMTYFPQQIEVVRENLRNHGLDPDVVDFRVSTSAVAFQEATERDDRFDFMLIDGSHKISGVMADLRWTRLLNVGGVVCFHDYSPKFPGVWMSVNRFLAGHPNYKPVGQSGTLLAIRKRGPSPRPEVSSLDRAYAAMWTVPLKIQHKVQKYQERKQKAA